MHMKKVLVYVLEGIKACLNALMGALCFVKIEHDVAVYPADGGGTERADYYYSIYDKLYIALAVMAASVVLSVVACVAKDNLKIRIASHIIFVVSALFFVVLLIYSTQFLQYMY